MQTLNYYKTKVSAMSTESKRLDEDIQQRHDLQDKIDIESTVVSKVR